MIHVIATIEVHVGRREAFLAEFRKVVPLVLAEDGCLAYGPTVDVDSGLSAQGGVRDDTVTIVEAWEGLDHLQAHIAAPHMQEYRGRVADLVVKTTLAVLAPV